MRRDSLMLAIPVLLACWLAAGPAEAADFGVRAGTYTDAGEAFVGGEVLIELSSPWFFNPNVEYVFIDDGDLITVNGDFHYDFDVEGPVYVWAGAGAALIFRDDDRPRPGDDDDGDTELGVNLLAGVGWRTPSVVPYIQGKVILSDDSEAALAFGVRF